MTETILSAEPTIRLAAFLGVLAAMALWEVAALRRRREISRLIRWTNNIALVVLDTVILRLTFPILAVRLAVMAIYLQHVMFHAVPGLWRLHRMHHANIDLLRPVDRVLRLSVVTTRPLARQDAGPALAGPGFGPRSRYAYHC